MRWRRCSYSGVRASQMLAHMARMCVRRAVDGASSRTSVAGTNSMFTKSLRQCHACRLTWFPQGGAASCPACGGTKIGGTLELFHAGLALIALGAVGWLFRHGPLSEPGTAPPPAVAHAAQLTESPERRNDVYVASKKIKTDKVKVKRRQKKAKTRSKHVQR
jgi:hypothetical protein